LLVRSTQSSSAYQQRRAAFGKLPTKAKAPEGALLFYNLSN